MTIGNVEIGAIVVGVVEFLKKLNVNGKWSLVVALALGVVLFGYSAAVDAGLVSEAVNTWVTIFVRAVGGAIAIPGLYDLIVKRIAKVPSSA
jgi:uncharacterized membrane protein